MNSPDTTDESDTTDDNHLAGADRPPMRADARRNRASILRAAEAAFADEGLGVPVDEIARRAGVGAGTLYRHFPTKEALYEAVVVQHMEALADTAEDLASRPDPGPALFDFIEQLGQLAASKRNLMEALSGADIDFKDAANEPKARVEACFDQLVSRAQEAGEIRSDITGADVIGLVIGTCQLAEPDVQGCSRARMLSVVCEGLRPAR